MAGKRQLKPIEVFEANIADAERLLAFTSALENGRRWTRVEKKTAIGTALGVPARDHGSLGCVESNDVFVVIEPTSGVRVEHFSEKELRPLLRQALVAISAAVESYVAVKACSYASAALRANPLPNRMKNVVLSLDAVIDIEASPSPTRIGIVFSRRSIDEGTRSRTPATGSPLDGLRCLFPTCAASSRARFRSCMRWRLCCRDFAGIT
jgi:hypothetical protein